MKKIYFATDSLGPIYYMVMPDDWSEDRLNIGYNDSYEMRSVYIGKSQFSENYEDIKKLLEKNKQYLISQKYEELLRLTNIEFKKEEAIEHDGFDAP